MLIILAILMFVVAVVFSIIGQGGGVLYTPIQVWAGVDFHVAATTSLFLIIVMSLSASIVFRRANKIDWALVLVVETSATLGGFAGGLWSGQFSGNALSVLLAAERQSLRERYSDLPEARTHVQWSCDTFLERRRHNETGISQRCSGV